VCVRHGAKEHVAEDSVRSAGLCDEACLVALVGAEETNACRQHMAGPASVRCRPVRPAAVPRARRSVVCPAASSVPHPGNELSVAFGTRLCRACREVRGEGSCVTDSKSHLLHHELLLLHVVLLLLVLLLLLRGV